MNTNPNPSSTSPSPRSSSRYEQFIRRQQTAATQSQTHRSGVALPSHDPSEPVHLRIDKETTPKLLLQALDVAIQEG